MINIAGTENAKHESTKPETVKPVTDAASYKSAGGNAEEVLTELIKGLTVPRSPLSGQGQYIEGRFWGDVMINIVGIESAGSIPDVAPPGGANYEGAGGNIQGAQMSQGKAVQAVKSLVDLMPGQVFSAEILDIQPGVINLKMGEDGSLAARTLSSPDARIGDNATFVVRENVPALGNTPAQITLEFLRGAAVGENVQVPASIVKEALAAANMQYTGQNSALIEALVAHNLPIDHNSVQRAAFFRYSMPDVPFSRIAFLMENNFAPTERTVEVFLRLVGGELNLRSETANLQRLVNEATFQNPATREALQTMISGKLVFEPQMQAQGQGGQAIELQNSQLTELGKFLTQLRGLTQEMTAFLRQSGEDIPLIRQSLENISDILDFARNIGETKMYYQFPFGPVGKEHLAELHIFKKKAARKTSGKNATALIGLDMAHLGRVEVLVNKAGRDVNLQFRTDNGKTIMLVGENKAKLADLLGDKGYLLTGLGMKMIDEKFDIADGEKKEAPNNAPPVDSAGAKRYSFDMRV
jgi:hypothetical protein